MLLKVVLVSAAFFLTQAGMVVGQEETRDMAGAVGTGVGMNGKGQFNIVVVPREQQGRLVICGMAWVEDDAGGIGRRAVNLLDLLTIRLDNELVTVKATRFNRYKSRAEANRGAARCLATDKIWKPSYAKARVTLKMRGYEL